MRDKVKKILTVILGTVIVAISLDAFLAPSGIAPGGLSGLAIVINHLTAIPLGLLILLLNIPIFILGLRYFNKRFMLFSLIGMFMLSTFTDIFVFLPKVTEDMLLSAIYGGALMGLGLGLVFNAGFTTGGTDIAAQILKKKHPSISVGRFVLVIDAFIVSIAGIVFAKWEVLLYSSIALYISTFIIDVIVEGGDLAKVAYIISDNPKNLSESISATLERGTTLLHASSFFSGEEKSVLLCVVKKYEITKLKGIIQEIDKNAFVILSDAREVLGNGFKSH